MVTRTFPESLDVIESVTSLETEKRTPTVTPTITLMYLGYGTTAIPLKVGTLIWSILTNKILDWSMIVP